MLRHLREWSTAMQWKTYEMPINPHSGVQLDLIETASVAPLATEEDYRAYLARLRALPRVINGVIEVLQAGKKDGLVSFGGLIDESISQCLSVGNSSGEKNPFARAVLQFPAEMSDRQRAAWKTRLLTSIRRDVGPAYLRLARYLKHAYAPYCRTEPGIWTLPDGGEYSGEVGHDYGMGGHHSVTSGFWPHIPAESRPTSNGILPHFKWNQCPTCTGICTETLDTDLPSSK